MQYDQLHTLESICKRISLNIPENCPWRWDKNLNLAIAVISRKDEIMVGLPLSLEFSYQWDFFTIDNADTAVRDYFQTGFGVMPGQKLFVQDPVNGVVLFAAWWPWGDDERISIRLGLISITNEKIQQEDVKRLMCKWLNIK